MDNAIRARLEGYLDRLALDDERRRVILERTLADAPGSPAEALTRAQGHLDRLTVDAAPDEGAGDGAMPDDADEAGIRGMLAGRYPGWSRRVSNRAADTYRGASMPRCRRAQMAPPHASRGLGRILRAAFSRQARAREHTRPHETRLGRIVCRRQFLLALIIMIPAAAATMYMATVLPNHGATILELAILAIAFLLFAWILVGFWTACAGFFLMWRGDQYCIEAAGQPSEEPEDNSQQGARTAILMPICEESVTRACAGLRAVYESIQAAGHIEDFDFYILSDSSAPDTCVAETAAWAELCRELDAFGQIFYRRREARVSRKSGNLADFCRRWGRNYPYMLVLDADSIMCGETIVELVARMDANPSAGLIQTPPTGVNRQSALARIQQFSMRVYGPMFAAGLHYWHLDKGHYWGHNAIIRVDPFMEHCALPALAGHGVLSGDILSHDFVEAAFLRRAGWGVHIAYDLGGSYEEVPPSLIEELGRDRRWCRGNLQHMRLLFADNLSMAHRALFANGVMAYGSAALWFLFLLLSSSEAVMQALKTPQYFSNDGQQLFPHWPVWQPFWALSLFVATMVVLFLPKVLGLFLVVAKRQHHAYGGVLRLVASTLIEVLLTSTLAPIRMVAHARFVTTTLLGRTVRWDSQQRADATVAWRRAFAYHAPGMVIAVVWGGVLLATTPGFAPWLAPILLPLLFAPVLTVVTSRADLGRWLARRGVALIPEENQPPTELSRIRELVATASPEPNFANAVVDPTLNALCAGLARDSRSCSRTIGVIRETAARQALARGTDDLEADDARRVLTDRHWLRWLHRRVWSEMPAAWVASESAMPDEHAGETVSRS
ncbi:glucans biosynthesis glucosyltransferase MdoH [Salinisphaera sp. USBA-960]|nr:glucans biosynthesis glucosyltransferase MdoH [Salifodinibacter halophilus]NNC27011.1 glucans biosynthesis glucosyltransferase MdoH [Salifodinibacter halophilus]